MARHQGAWVAAFILATGIAVGNMAFGQRSPAVMTNDDARIQSLITHIEDELTTSTSLPPDVLTTLAAALQLMASASPTGQQLLTAWPGHLKARAKAERASQADDSFMKATNMDVVAEFAGKYIGEHEANAQPPLPMASQPEPPETASVARAPPPAPPPKTASVVPPAPPQPLPAPPAPPPKTTASVVPPAPPQPPPKAAIAPDKLRMLLARGDAMLKEGNVSAARMFYERAAEDGGGLAAFKMGQTYDSEFLAARNLLGIKPDGKQADAWYQKAAALGESQAAQRLKAMASPSIARQ